MGGGRVCQGEIWNIQLAHVEVRVPPQWDCDEKNRGKTVGLEQPVKGRRGEWGGEGGELKLEPSPCSIKTPQRDLCRQRRPVERIPLKPINRQRTRGFHRGGAPSATQQQRRRHTSWRTSVWFGSKRKRMLRDRLQLMLVLSSAASPRKKKRYSRVCQETVQW